MNVFLGDIAYILEIALIGTGFVILHYAFKEKSKLMKAGAYIMLIGGVLGLICTSYFSIKFWVDGSYNYQNNESVHSVTNDNHFFSEE